MEILPIASSVPEPEMVAIENVEQPESYSDIAMLDSAEIEATFDALTHGPGEDVADFEEPEVPPPTEVSTAPAPAPEPVFDESTEIERDLVEDVM